MEVGEDRGDNCEVRGAHLEQVGGGAGTDEAHVGWAGWWEDFSVDLDMLTWRSLRSYK